MPLQTLLEGLGLGALRTLVCAFGIRKDAVGMVHLYEPKVQDLTSTSLRTSWGSDASECKTVGIETIIFKNDAASEIGGLQFIRLQNRVSG